MKKNVLALSIAAAIGGLGFAGGAFAVTDAPISTVNSLATAFGPAEAGIGHVLVVPYYTAQTKHATLINLVNTDTTNGKAVKVRFRGAANSDDVYDFQVFLSPGDVWAANVSQDAATGLAKLTTTDKSCTKPASVNGTFVTTRLRAAWSDAKKAENTREGYVEIFNMADIPPKRLATATAVGSSGVQTVNVDVANELYTAIKHVAGAKPPCSGTAWDYIDTDRTAATYKTSSANGMMWNPTSGLMGNWTIINVDNASAWGAATPAFVATLNRVATTANLVYFPQVAADLSNIAFYTADPLFTATSPTILTPQLYDMPDLSTPYISSVTDPNVEALTLSTALETSSVKNEYLTDPDINATTDWVFSMPSRRYIVAVNYEALNTAGVNVPVRVFNSSTLLSGYFTTANTTLTNDQVCVKNVKVASFDREEQTLTSSTDTVISPNKPGEVVVFCGEASILTVNNPGAAKTGVLEATVAYKNMAGFSAKEGWISLTTPGASAGYGLPILGGAFVRATAGASTFGANWDHRYTRVINVAQ